MESGIRTEALIWFGFVLVSVVFLFPCVFWVRKTSSDQSNVEYARLNRQAILFGAAPAAAFLLTALSLFFHAWIATGKPPRMMADEPDSVIFRIHALAAPISVLAIPLEIILLAIALRDLAKKGANSFLGILAFATSALAVWALIKADPRKLFAWYFD